MSALLDEIMLDEGGHVTEKDVEFLEALGTVFKEFETRGGEYEAVALKWGVSHHIPSRLVGHLGEDEVMYFSEENPIEEYPSNRPPAERSYRRVIEVRSKNSNSYCCDYCWKNGKLVCCGMCQ